MGHQHSVSLREAFSSSSLGLDQSGGASNLKLTFFYCTLKVVGSEKLRLKSSLFGFLDSFATRGELLGFGHGVPHVSPLACKLEVSNERLFSSQRRCNSFDLLLSNFLGLCVSEVVQFELQIGQLATFVQSSALAL